LRYLSLTHTGDGKQFEELHRLSIRCEKTIWGLIRKEMNG
jgi:hypothetical protein